MRSTITRSVPKVPAAAMSWKVAALVALLVVGVGAAGAVVVGPAIAGQGAVQYLTSPVTRTTVARQVVASGAVRPAATYDLAFGAYPVIEAGTTPASGGAGGAVWLVQSVAVKLGDQVKKGAVLATADSAAAAAALQLAQANLAAAEARLAVDTAGATGADRAAAFYAISQARQQLDLAKQGRTGTAAANDLALSQAQAAVQAATIKLSSDQLTGIQADQAAVAAAAAAVDTLKLANELAIAQAQAALQAAQATLAADQVALASAATIRADWAAVAAAVQQQSLTARQTDLKMAAAQTALQNARARLVKDQTPGYSGPPSSTIQGDQAAIAAAQQQLDSLKLTFASSVSKAASGIVAAELALAIAQNDYTRRVAPASATVLASDAASVVGAQESVRQAQLALDGATLRSPVDGVVTTLAITPGALAPAGTDVAIAAGAMEVVAVVTETDLPSLKVGQGVTVTLTALGTTATGTVRAIDPRGAAPGGGGVVTYPVTVALDATPPGTAAAMSAQVAVTIAQAKNVLAIPSIALLGNTGHYRVRVLDASGNPVEKPVAVGLITTSLAEISSGLALDEIVVTGTTAPLQNTTTPAGGLPGLLPAGGGGNGGG